MKKLLFITAFLVLAGVSHAQVVFDLGLKAGVHTSKLNFEVLGDISDLDSESITSFHYGAFGRIGYNRLYVQPEVYFGKKGSKLNVEGDMGDFDYKNVDVPLLLGYKLTDGKLVDFRILAGPVFSFMSDAKFDDEKIEDYFEDNMVGIQYGIGADVLFLTIDARVEHGGNVYKEPEILTGKATSFMLTVGFKIL